jgi:hypothetical protein
MVFKTKREGYKMTLKEKAAAIRSELRALNIRASVRMRSGSAINIDIMDLSADMDVVSEIAGRYENVRRCEFTFEILSGGNDYVFYNYDYDVLREARVPYEELASRMLAEGGPIGEVAVVEDRAFLVRFDGADTTLVMSEGFVNRAWAYGAYNHFALAEGLAIIDARYGLELLTGL